MKLINYKLGIITLLMSWITFSCISEDDFDTKPTDVIEVEEALNTESGVAALLNGIYGYFREFNTSKKDYGHDDFGQKSIDLSTDLMTLDMIQTRHHWFGDDYLLLSNDFTYPRTFINWNFYYVIIRAANRIIKASGATEDMKGQAYALRAFSYFNLVRLYEDTYSVSKDKPAIPIYEEVINEGQPRQTVSEIYKIITADLDQAYVSVTSTSNTVLNIYAVRGLMARVYLEMQDYTKAAQYANEARMGNFTLMGEADYLSGFSDISNSEWMFGSDITSLTHTTYASFISHIDNTNPGYAGLLKVYKSIDKSLYESIADTDYRKKVFNDPSQILDTIVPAYGNLKFRGSEGSFFEADVSYMRVSEMYLIEAEAKAHLGDDSAADVLFELISQRDPSYVMSTETGTALVDEIFLHKRIELWGEGQSLFDYKRLRKDVIRNYSG
ncbi:MAG: RagB/SusD family nutrient uptake outer membrane protein, partial [Flavobacteriales bacterium]